MLAAVDHIHRRGIAHLDIKPHNFIISDGFKVHLIDFSLATVIPVSGYITSHGGSYGYTAPEMLRLNARYVDATLYTHVS